MIRSVCLLTFVILLAVQSLGYGQVTFDEAGDVSFPFGDGTKYYHSNGEPALIYTSGEGIGVVSFAGQKIYLSTSSSPGGTSTARLTITPTGNVGIGVWNPSYNLEVNGDAAKPGGGFWSVSSDIRLKNIGGYYSKGLKEILRLRPVNFRYKEENPLGLPSDTTQIGFISQEVQEVFPESVREGKMGYLDFNMHPINIAMINAIKELSIQNRALKVEIEALRSMLSK